jgi:hypothetical protein
MFKLTVIRFGCCIRLTRIRVRWEDPYVGGSELLMQLLGVGNQAQ